MLNRKEAAALNRVWKHLQTVGALVVSDSKLPSLAGLVAEEPLRGSWWAHPEANAIFRVGEALEARQDVLTARLISGKVTLVHKRLWPALFAVATAGEQWQLRGLSPQARALLALVLRRGVVRTDELAASGEVSAKALGETARELEKRLLVYGESLHTESGAHTKKLESWRHLAKRLHVKIELMSPESARQEFERVAARLEFQYRARVRYLWPSGLKKKKRLTGP